MARHISPNSGSLKCDVPGCRDTKTYSKLGLALHKRFTHGIPGAARSGQGKAAVASAGPYTCDVCDQKFASPQVLGRHKFVAHDIQGASKSAVDRLTRITQLSGPPYKCDICGAERPTAQALGLHKRWKHNILGTSRPAPDSPFTCGLCDRHFRNQHGLSLHMTLKHKGQRAVKLTAEPSAVPSLEEAITALEVKRDTLQWVIEDLKRIANSQ